jgi:hypothetical protein
MDQLIRQAITERRIVKFTYRGQQRSGEPHVYGMVDGLPQVLIYQTGGSSSRGRLPGWRRCDLEAMRDISLTGEAFAGRRSNPSGDHSEWDETWAIVS